jgi:hypothetical protein
MFIVPTVSNGCWLLWQYRVAMGIGVVNIGVRYNTA